jgi:hypothetical protein
MDGRGSGTSGAITIVVDPRPRICVNDMITIYHLVLGGAGLGTIFDHLAFQTLKPDGSYGFCPTGRYLQWKSTLFSRAKGSLRRVFVDFLKEIGVRDKLWKKHSL